MRPPVATESQGKWGLVSIVCSAGAFLAIFAGVLPFVGCIATPLGLLSSLSGVVLGVIAIIDGGRRNDLAERLRGVAGVVLGLALPIAAGAAVLFFSRSMLRDAFSAPPAAVAAPDAGP
ncbi:MAG: hypothetical protein AB1730_16575 [Myxococcota bacterium]|jgi:hypothetical protein